MPTIFDVAREAGVSTAAVSLVMNDAHTNRVGAEKRKQILQVARRLGYTANALARGLAQRRTHIVGLVVPMRDPIFFNHFIAEVLSGIQSCLIERDYHLMVYSHRARTGKVTRRQVTQNHLADGIILFNTRLCTDADIQASIRELRAAGLPFVMMNTYYGDEAIRYVGVDDRAVAHQAGAYLASRGHRRMALLLGAHRSPLSGELAAGFGAALSEAGLEQPLVAAGEYDAATVAKIVAQWMRRKQPPTAMLCADDQIAPDVYAALRAEGRRIPEDVAVMGRGDLMVTAHLTPGLTTIRMPTFEMGRRAAELLTSVLDGKAVTTGRVLLPTSLVRRESA